MVTWPAATRVSVPTTTEAVEWTSGSYAVSKFKNELHNLLLSVLEQCDDYLDTDQITFDLKKERSHEKLDMSMPTHCVLLLGFTKNEQILMEKLLERNPIFIIIIIFF